MAKTDISKVHPGMARAAKAKAKDRQAAWSEYIRIHFQSTGRLAPGCNAKDFYAVYDMLDYENMLLDMLLE